MAPAATANTLYDETLVYDVLHTPGAASEVTGLERIADRFVRTSARDRRRPWLEPACGTGRYLRVIAARGRTAIGYDMSEAMVAFANERLERRGLTKLAKAVVADMTAPVPAACPPGGASFAFNPINSFRHLMTDADAIAHLDGMAEALAPGGVYAVGLSVTAYGLEPPTEDVWEARRGGMHVAQLVQYEPPTGRDGGSRVERVVSHITVTTPSSTRHVDSAYGLRTYSLDQWRGLVDRSAMTLDAVTDELGADADAPQLGYRMFILRPRRS